MREQAGPDLLMFLLLRWTGLRGVDAVKLLWSEVHFDRKELERVTQKRKKRVILPMYTELLLTLEAEHEKLKPEPLAQVLLNPATGNPLTRPRMYSRILALGKRAGVAGAHPAQIPRHSCRGFAEPWRFTLRCCKDAGRRN
jgi:integrase